MKTLCLYHDDLDGRASAAVLYHCLTPSNCTYQSIQYGDSLPEGRFDVVYILDFSLEPRVLKSFLDDGVNVIWIDHHQSAIEKYADFKIPIPGIRADGKAGCELTWMYCTQRGQDLPRYLSLLSEYDAFKGGGPSEDAFSLVYASGMYETSSPKDEFWSQIHSKSFVDKLLRDGKIILSYRTQFYNDLIQDIGYDTELDGVKCHAINAGRVGSREVRAAPFNKHPVTISYYHDGEKFICSLYSSSVDVSKLAAKYGGGGHKGASGFTCKTLPFKKIM
jgi:uncharacterized protein